MILRCSHSGFGIRPDSFSFQSAFDNYFSLLKQEQKHSQSNQANCLYAPIKIRKPVEKSGTFIFYPIQLGSLPSISSTLSLSLSPCSHEVLVITLNMLVHLLAMSIGIGFALKQHAVGDAMADK